MNSNAQRHSAQNQLALGMSYPELALLTNLGQHLFSSVAHQGYAHSQEQQYKADEEMDERPSNGRGRTRSGGDSRSSSAYASRHQAAEQRRRTRINERLDLLRKLVPHAERANTACFLEEVIKYIEHLKAHNSNLQRMVDDARAGSRQPPGSAAPVANAAAAAGAGLQQQHVSMPALASVSLPVLPLLLPGRIDATERPQHLQDPGALPGPREQPQQVQEAPAHADVGPLPGSATYPAVSQPAAPPASTPPPGAAEAVPSAEPAAAPSASQALMGLQGLLPGVDVQALLQQALLNAQAQLLQQAQQHQATVATAAGGAASSTSTSQAAAAGLAAASSSGVPPAPARPQQHSSQMKTLELQQPSVSQPALLAPAESPPPASFHQQQQQQRSLLSVLKAPAIPDALHQGQQQQQQKQAGASNPADGGIIPGSTLPAELQKLKAQLEGSGSHTRLQEVTTAAGQVLGTSANSHFALIPPSAGFVLPKEAQQKEASLSGRQSAAALPPLAGAGASLLTERGSGGRASSSDMGDFAGLADGAGLGGGVHLLASAAAKAAADAAGGSVGGAADRPGSQSPLANDQEDVETTVPHKKRKMLVL